MLTQVWLLLLFFTDIIDIDNILYTFFIGYNKHVSTSPHQKWRLIVSQPASGAWNMALDQALMESAIDQDSIPTLRLFGWTPPCLSLGYAQNFEEVDQGMLETLRWDLVRRPTGGRAILHTDELTYSITMPLSHPVASVSILESYRRLSVGLVAGLKILGLTVNADKTYPKSISDGSLSPVCFETPSNYEITIQGKKLVGSAQARRNGGLLQHGSLPLMGDLSRIVQVLVYDSIQSQQAALKRLDQHAVTVENVLGKVIDWNTAARAIQDGFSQSLNCEFIPDSPTPKEIERAERLVEEVYANPSWTFRL